MELITESKLAGKETKYNKEKPGTQIKQIQRLNQKTPAKQLTSHAAPWSKTRPDTFATAT
jgi:hypothetical protein